ncbi:hypothetical protein [Jongsikchunia kroppenstedtii]|uniref:hypothetical protein n=1 Tax=Jongsikchunia kroppenstedtii TaxID=1121721 RepID=UPI00035F4AE0|nr:hypothetical protein [Jongsikchunia kroppenstedtii]
MTAGAISLGTATATAAPAKPTPANQPVSVQVAPGIQYTGDGATGSAEIVTPFGTVKTASGQVAVQDTTGKTLYGNPEISTPKPAAPVAASAKVNAALPGAINADAPKSQADKNADIQTAIGTVGTNFGLAVGVGAMVGGVGGAAIGCAVPGLVGVATTAGALSIPACLAGAATLGGLGAIVGGAAVGAPVGIASGIQQYQQLQANGDL